MTPAPAAAWHTGLYMDGAPYPTRHHAHPGQGHNEAHLDLTPEDLQYLKAIHEAAHAVTAITGGGHLHHAQIQGAPADGDAEGVTLACGLNDGQTFAAFCGAGERADDRWLREASLWTPRRAVAVEAAARNDRRLLLGINPHIGFGDKQADYRTVHDLADHAIDRHWGEIATVADALMKHIRLDGDAIADLIRIPNGPHRANNTEEAEGP